MDKVLIVPRYLAFLRFIEIPSIDDAEIQKMVEFQAIKEIPHPKEEMVIGYRNFGSYKEGFSSIMLAIVKRQIIAELLSEKEKNNIHIDTVRLHTELLYLFLIEKNLLKQDKVNFVVYIGDRDSEILIIDKTRPIFSRGFGNNTTLLEELSRSVLVYDRDKEKKDIENIIVLHSEGLDITNVKDYIEGHFRIQTTFHKYTNDNELISVFLQARIELLPKEISERRIRLERTRERIVTYSLVGGLLLLIVGFVFYKIYEKNRILNKLSLKIDEMQSDINMLDRFLSKIGFAKAHKELGSYIIDIFFYSYKLIPPEIFFSGLSYDGDGNIFYRGTSQDASFVFAFVKGLEGSGYFSKVEIKYATKKRVRDKEVTDFNIQCQLLEKVPQYDSSKPI